MTTIILAPEQNETVQRAGDEPVRVIDPFNHRTHILIRDYVYHRLVATVKIRPSPLSKIPEGVRKSQASFFRDLPELLRGECLRGQRVICQGDEQNGIAPGDEPHIGE